MTPIPVSEKAIEELSRVDLSILRDSASDIDRMRFEFCNALQKALVDDLEEAWEELKRFGVYRLGGGK